MNTNEILEAIDLQITQLQQARALLADTTAGAPAIVATKQSTGKRRGRPKGSVNKKPEVAAPVVKKTTRSPLSAEGRARIAAAQKARWATQKKASKPVKPAAKKAAAEVGKKTVATTKKSVAVKRTPAVKSAAAPTTEA